MFSVESISQSPPTFPVNGWWLNFLNQIHTKVFMLDIFVMWRLEIVCAVSFVTTAMM